jgi:hypothetical protein
MSNLTDLLPAGAGGKQVDFVASGTIGNGVTVILNSNGTVSVTAAVDGITVGTPAVFESATSNDMVIAYDSLNNKVIIAYQDAGNSSYGTAVVGTVSGTSISFGTPVVFNASATYFPGIAYDTNAQKVVIAYTDNGNSNYGTAIVGTVSGTDISFGTAVVYESATAYYNNVAYDANAQKVVIVYQDAGNANYGTSIVGTVSGTSISFGTAVIFESAVTYEPRAVYDSTAQKVIITYTDNGNSTYGTAIVGSISGTSISFGSPTVFDAVTVADQWSAYDSTNNKIVIAYRNNDLNNYGRAVVGTVSGTNISFGTPVVFNNTGSTTEIAVTHDTYSGKTVISYQDAGNSNYGTAIVGTVSGTGATGTISFTSPTVFESASTSFIASTFDNTNNTTVIAYKDSGNSSYGTAITFATKSSNFSSFIGISDAAISDTATGSVTIKGGISTNVTGLTPNTDYYVQADGTLSTTTSTVLAGKALSATSINLDYTT